MGRGEKGTALELPLLEAFLCLTAVPNGEKVLKKVPSKVPHPEKWMGELRKSGSFFVFAPCE
jgi:hypothetical protein